MMNGSPLAWRLASLALAFVVTAAVPAFAAGKVTNCSFNGRLLQGKVQVVKSFPDFKVKVVTSFPDLKVQRVNTFPDSCGKWQFGTSFPDFTIQYVESFPDFSVQWVETFPGDE